MAYISEIIDNQSKILVSQSSQTNKRFSSKSYLKAGLFLLFLGFFFFGGLGFASNTLKVQEASAATYACVSVSGATDWNSAASWANCNSTYPGNIDNSTNIINVTFQTTASQTLTLSGALTYPITAITFPTTGAYAKNVVLNGFNMEVTGTTTMSRPATSGTNTLTVGTAQFKTGAMTWTATTTTRNAIITASTGTIWVTGTLAQGTCSTGCQITFSGSGLLKLDGGFSGTALTLTPSTSTVEYTSSTPEIQAYTYYNLKHSGSGATTGDAAGTITIQKDLTLTGGGSYNFSARPVTISGTNAQNLAGFTTSGLISMTKTGSSTATLTGNITGTGGLTMNGSGGTLALSTYTLDITGTVTNTAGTLSAASGKMVYSGAAQTVIPTTYNNLTLSGSGNKTAATTPTVNGTLSMEGTAAIIVTSGVVTYGASATLQYNKPATYTATTEEFITPTTIPNLIIASTGAITIHANATTIGTSVVVNDGATLRLGNQAFTSSGTLTLGSGGAGATLNVAGAGSTGTYTFGDITVNASSVFDLSTGTHVTSFGGNIAHSGTTFNTGASATSAFTTTKALSGTSSMTFGATTQTINSGIILTNNSTGTVTFSGTLAAGNASSELDTGSGSTTKLGGSTPMSSGIIKPSASANTIDYTGATPTCITPTTNNYYHLTFSGATGAITCTVTATAGNVTVSGAGGTWTPVLATIPGNLLVNGTSVVTLGQNLSITGSLSVTSTAAAGLITGNFTLSVGTTTTIGASATLSHRGNTTVTFTGALTVDGTLSNTAAGTGTITAKDNITGSGTITLNNATQIFIQLVAADKTFGSTSNANNWAFSSLSFETDNAGGAIRTIQTNTGGSGTIVVDGTLTVGNAGYTYTTILDNNTNDRIIDCNGALDITTKGSFTASSSASFTVATNFTNSGTFTTPTNSTITFDTTATSVISGTTAFYNFTSNAATKTINFTAGQTFTFNGAITLDNATLNSTTGSSSWTINHQGTESITNTTVSWSACDGSSTTITLTSGISGGNNGICWSFPAVRIISGVVYNNDETAYGTATAMKLSVNGGSAYSTNSTITTGVFSFNVSEPSNGNVITIWLDTGGVGSIQGTLVFKYGASCTGTPDCTGLSVVRDQVRIQNFHTGNITNADLAVCDNNSGSGCTDTDIGFTSELSGTYTLTNTWTTNEIGIPTGTTFAPGGNVVAKKLEVVGTYTGGTETLTLSGAGTSTTCTNSAAVPLCATGTFTPTSNTVAFTSTSATSIAPGTFNNLSFTPAGTVTHTLLVGTFTVGGNFSVGNSTNAVTVQANTNDPTLNITGNLTINNNGIFQASNSGGLNIGGSYSVGATNGSFVHNNGTITFTSTSGGKTIDNQNSQFGTVVFDGVGGAWQAQNAGIISNDSLTITNGDLSTSGVNLYIPGSLTVNGTISGTAGGKLIVRTDGANIAGTGSITVTDLYIGDEGDGAATISSTGSGSVTVTNVFTIWGAQVYNAGTRTYILSKTGTGQITNSGTFNADTSTVRYTGNGATTISNAVTYNNLQVYPGGASVTHTLPATLTVNGNLDLGGNSNAASTVITAATNNTAMTVKGNITLCAAVCSNDITYTKGSGTATLSPTGTKTITDNNVTKQDLGNISITGGTSTPKINLGSSITATTITTVAASHELSLNGSNTLTLTGITGTPLSVSGTFTASTGTVAYTGATPVGDTAIANVTYNNLTLSAAESWTMGTNQTVSGTLTITTGTLTAPSGTLTIGNDFTNNGAFVDNSGTVAFNDSAQTTVLAGATTFNNLSITTADKTVNFTAGQTFVTNGLLTITGTSGHNVVIGSTSASQWLINHQGTESINYITLSYSGCDGSSTTITITNATDNGNNGVCWSGLAGGITVTGTIYSNEGANAITSGPTVRVKVAGAGNFSAVANGSGAYSIGSVSGVTAGSVITIFIDNATENGVVITKAVDDITNISANIYQNRIILRHENASAITNANINTYDSTQETDGDIGLDSTGTNVVVADGWKLIVWTGKSYTPGGTITTSTSNDGTDSNVDGDFDIQAGATVNVSTSAVSIGGDFNNLGTYTTFLNTTTFTATATGHTITAGTHTLYGVTFNGAGGEWSFTDNVVIGATLTITSGTLSGTTNITMQSSAPNVTGAGTINLTGGTFYFKLGTSSSFGSSSGSNNWTFYNLNFENTDAANRSVAPRAGGSGSVIVSNVLTIGNAGNTYSSTLNLDTSDRIFDVNGDVVITSKGLLTASNSASFTVSGNWTNNGTFTGTSGSTITFDSTSAGKTLSGTLNGASAFDNLVFDGVGGSWSNSTALLVNNNLSINNGTLDNSTADITVTGNVSVAGTLQGTGNLTVNGGGVTGNGTISMSAGTFLVDGTGNFGGNTAWTFNSLTFGDGSGATTVTGTGTGGITINNTMTVALNQILNGGTNTWILPATSTPFVVTGTFTGGSSTVSYRNATSATVTTANYNNLDFSPASGTPTYTLPDTLAIDGNFSIAGVGNATVTATTNDPALTVTGNFTIGSGDTFIASDIYSTSVGGSWANSGTFTHSNRKVIFTATSGTKTIDNGSSQFYNLEINGSGGTFQPSNNAITVTNDLTCTAGTLSGTLGITVNGGDVTGNCTINLTGGTFTVSGDSGTGFGGDTNWTFSSLSFTGDWTTTTATGSGAITTSAVLTVGTNHYLNAGSKTWTLSGGGTPMTRSGTLTAATSTFNYTSGSGVTALASGAMTGSNAYYNLIINGTGTFTAGVAVTAKNDLTVTRGTLALGTNNLIVGNTANSNSGNIKVASGQSLTQSSSGTTTVLSSAAGANCIGSSGASCSGTAGTLTFGGLIIGDDTTTFTTTVGATSPTISILGDFVINNNATFVAGSSSLSLENNGSTIFTKDESGTFTAGTGTVTFASSATTGTAVPTLAYNNLAVNKSGNTFTVASGTLVVGGTLTVTAGTLDLATNNPTTTITGTLTNSGTISAPTSLTLNNNFTNNGTFTANSGTVFLAPSGAQLSLGGSNSINFYNLSATGQNNKTIAFTNGSVYGVSNNLTLNGNTRDNLYLISSTPGSQWTINFTGSSGLVSYAYIKDGTCSGNNPNIDTNSIVDGGNNGTCWGFIRRGGGSVGAVDGGAPGGAGSQGGGSSQGGSGFVSATATAVLTNNVITNVNIGSGGSGYLSAPTVCFSGGGGSGGLATAVINGGAVTQINISNGGSSYSSPPSVLLLGGDTIEGGTGSCGSQSGGGSGGGGGEASP